MNIAIIPARGGSKRIPGKNIKLFCGKPMIAWSIETALASGCFDHVIVSTDDPATADIARQYGAETPFMRPASLADDLTATRPVINHAIEETIRLWGKPAFICCIYATAPFLRAQDLTGALQRLQAEDAEFIFSAGRFPYPIKRGFRITSSGRVERLWPEHRYTRSQDLEEVYHDAGQFYWGKTDAFLADRDTLSSSGIAYILPRTRVHDIDTEEDWQMAELIFRALKLHSTEHS